MKADETPDWRMAIRTATGKYHNGDLGEAERLILEALRTNPNSGQAMHLLGLIAFEKGNLQKAVNILRKATHIDPDNAQSFHLLGKAYMKKGDLGNALDALGAALYLTPENGDLWVDIASSHLMTGSPAKAKHAFKTAMRIKPVAIESRFAYCRFLDATNDTETAVLHYRRLKSEYPNHYGVSLEFGMLMQRCGRHPEALNLLLDAIRIRPDNPESRLRASLSLEFLGRYEEALLHLQIAAKHDPTNPIILNNIGAIYKKQHQFDYALKAFQKAIEIDAQFAEAHNNLAIVYREMGKLRRAWACCKKSLSIRPDFAEALNNAGLIHEKLGRKQQALQYCLQATRVKPDYADAYYQLGNLHRKSGDLDQAIDAYLRAVELNPELYQALNNLGNAYMVNGDRPSALAAYEKAIAVKPDFSQAYRHIATLKRFTKKDRFINGMMALIDRNRISVKERIDLNFALSKAHEDLQEYERAFGYMAEGNRLKRETFTYDKDNNTRLFASIKQVFNKKYLNETSGSGVKDPTPIFIVGMPRSGTTLVEQILQAHPWVYGGGELTTMDVVLSKKARKCGCKKFPHYVHQLDAMDFDQLGSAYLTSIRKLSSSSKHITDKMPQNFLFLGMIKLVLPNAKIVHCVRNPMDTCLSIYKNLFTRLHQYAYDLDELAHYYKLYQDLMRHWHDTLPGYFYDLDYEYLVADPEPVVRNLLDHCNLPWDDRCMEFYQSKRAVLTASTVQVRRPIYKDSVGLWEKYTFALRPLSHVFGVE